MHTIKRLFKRIASGSMLSGSRLFERHHGSALPGCCDIHFELGYLPPEVFLGVCVGSALGDSND